MGMSFSDSMLGNNQIKYNHIWNVVQALSDGGGIYTLSKQAGTVIDSNYIHDIQLAPYADPSSMVAVYSNYGSSYISVSNTVWSNVAQGFTNGPPAVGREA